MNAKMCIIPEGTGISLFGTASKPARGLT